MKKQVGSILRQLIVLSCAVLIVQSQTAFSAQTLPLEMQVPPQTAQPAAVLAPAQLDSLAAPLALYPDPLLSQVLVASTYPLEIVEAAQWVQQNPNLTGAALQDAVKHQSWDPSVQALTAFPEVLKELSGNIQWTTQLGNAFLAQQTGVMDAIQRLRSQAVSSGKLNSTPQQVVTTETQDGASAVEIQAADPQVIYVPEYDPMAIWGTPDFYPYPMIGYPFEPFFGGPFIGFGGGIFVGAYFGGWRGWGGWGWHPNWFGRSIMVNNGFFSRYGYNRGMVAGANVAGSGVWAHDPAHRLSVPYSNRQLTNQFRATAGAQTVRPQATAVARSLAARSFAGSAPARSANGYRPSVSNSVNSRTYSSAAPRTAAPTQSYRNNSPSRVAPAPQYSRAPSFSAPASRGGFAGGGFSGHAGGGGGHGSGRPR